MSNVYSIQFYVPSFCPVPLTLQKKTVGTQQTSQENSNQGATIKEAMVDTPPIPPQARA